MIFHFDFEENIVSASKLQRNFRLFSDNFQIGPDMFRKKIV